MEMDRVTAQLRAGVEPSSLSQFWRCRRNGMAGDCKSSDLGHNRFDPYHLHHLYNFIAPLSLVAEVRFCNPGVAVRFCQGAPNLGLHFDVIESG